MTQRMSQTPDPAKQPGTVTIHYNTDGVKFPFDIDVQGTPCGSGQTFPINKASDLPIELTLPAGCTGGTIEDKSGQSDLFAISIDP